MCCFTQDRLLLLFFLTLLFLMTEGVVSHPMAWFEEHSQLTLLNIIWKSNSYSLLPKDYLHCIKRLFGDRLRTEFHSQFWLETLLQFGLHLGDEFCIFSKTSKKNN